METLWYRLTEVHLEKWPLKWREIFVKHACMKKALRGDANTALDVVRQSQKF